jgi:hypothetical protein
MVCHCSSSGIDGSCVFHFLDADSDFVKFQRHAKNGVLTQGSEPLSNTLPGRRGRKTEGLLLAYMFPGRGKVLASGRRFREPFIELIYTLLICALLALVVYFVWFAYTHEPTNLPIGLTTYHAP